MNIKQKFAELGSNIVYVKEIETTDLPADLQAEAGDLETIFSVHNADGEQLALVANRSLAFHLAREHKMVPVTVH
ncbi:MAG: DUF1150 family protein [Pseudomonadota bacterium]